MKMSGRSVTIDKVFVVKLMSSGRRDTVSISGQTSHFSEQEEAGR